MPWRVSSVSRHFWNANSIEATNLECSVLVWLNVSPFNSTIFVWNQLVIREILDWFDIPVFRWMEISVSVCDAWAVCVWCNFDNRFYFCHLAGVRFTWGFPFELILIIYTHGTSPMHVVDQPTTYLFAVWIYIYIYRWMSFSIFLT